MRCRLAHNHDTARRRVLSDKQRHTFLATLRSGKSVEEAAEEAGVSSSMLAQVARRDGELRAALDGMPVDVQMAARRAEFLASLVRCGGQQKLAAAQAGLSIHTVKSWREGDPEFDAVVVAILTWLGAATKAARRDPRRGPRKPPVRLKTADVERLRQMWADGATVQEVAGELGVSRNTVDRWRQSLGLPPRREQRQNGFERLGPEFRKLWMQGATYPEIRAALDISDVTISKWRKQLRLPGRTAGQPGA
ncbi:helix-turn-helix domain-containing protein [Streptomyces sp. EAS-AB2608]|uniref:helix-turn-helix domain-containing protein n=1 Tax=Streptomyces sp. EAS-AB2608 TaxID=2779671 RepID=UPI001C84D500|nr:helix-turn-helix domain-containing protein [Streptomyces sp. EAS-AB2608]